MRTRSLLFLTLCTGQLLYECDSCPPVEFLSRDVSCTMCLVRRRVFASITISSSRSSILELTNRLLFSRPYALFDCNLNEVRFFMRLMRRRFSASITTSRSSSSTFCRKGGNLRFGRGPRWGALLGGFMLVVFFGILSQWVHLLHFRQQF